MYIGGAEHAVLQLLLLLADSGTEVAVRPCHFSSTYGPRPYSQAGEEKSWSFEVGEWSTQGLTNTRPIQSSGSAG